VILEDGAAPSPQVQSLVQAKEAGARYSAAPGVVPCPYAKEKKEEGPKPPLKVVLWHIRELGGGFQSPAKRPDFCIAAYAALIHATHADVAIVVGLGRSIGLKPVKDHGHIRVEKESSDTGLAEARRLTLALGSDWRLASANGPDNKPVYHKSETACFLYNTNRGIHCGAVTLVKCGAAFLAIAPMQIPGTFDAPPTLPLLAPLSVGRRTSSDEEAPGPQANGELPAMALIGFSALDGLKGSSDYAGLRSACDVEYAPPLNEGTLLQQPFWEKVAADSERLLENHMAVNPADVILQNKAMYWEALPPAEHPKALDKVSGRLADALLVRKTGGATLRLDKVRALDLVRASLDSAALGELGRGSALPEDSVLVSQRKAYAATLPKTKQASAGSSSEVQIAEASLFVRKLSDHWPILADVYLA
jgi:hypothetical protein